MIALMSKANFSAADSGKTGQMEGKGVIQALEKRDRESRAFRTSCISILLPLSDFRKFDFE
jgi:hypothetical protein